MTHQDWKDLFAEVRKETRNSQYMFRSEIEYAPKTVNCLTLAIWIFELIGITLPYDIGRIASGGRGVNRLVYIPGGLFAREIEIDDTSRPGDILVVQGRGYYDHPDYGKVGHLGIVTEKYDVLHATRRQKGAVCGVIEESLEEFLTHHGPLRTARRMF